jgi:hypothetical protein
MYVMSPHHLVFASVAVNFRPIRSGAGAGLSPATVVTFHALGCRPCRSTAFINRYTRFAEIR